MCFQFCLLKYIRKFIVFSSGAIIVLSTIIRKLQFYRMLPQTIAILSSEQKKSRNFCQMFAGLVSLSSWVLIFMTQKSSQTGWGAGSSSAPASVLSSAASSSSGKQPCLVSGGGDGAMNSPLSSRAGSAVRVSSLQKWVLLCSLPRVSDWRKDKLLSTSVSRLATAG